MTGVAAAAPAIGERCGGAARRGRHRRAAVRSRARRAGPPPMSRSRRPSASPPSGVSSAGSRAAQQRPVHRSWADGPPHRGSAPTARPQGRPRRCRRSPARRGRACRTPLPDGEVGQRRRHPRIGGVGGGRGSAGAGSPARRRSSRPPARCPRRALGGLVDDRREPGVGGAPPALVEPTVESGRSERDGSYRQPAASVPADRRGRPRRRRSRRPTRQARPAVCARQRRGGGAPWPAAVRPRRTARTAAGAAATARSSSPAPTTRPPGSAPGSARRRAAAGPRRAPRRRCCDPPRRSRAVGAADVEQPGAVVVVQQQVVGGVAPYRSQPKGT